MPDFKPLTPQALRANAELIRRLHTGPLKLTVPELAEDLGRDKENLRKSLALLTTHGLVDMGPPIALTDLGREVHAALPPPPEAPAAAQANAVRAPVHVNDLEGFAAIPHALIVPDVLNPRGAFDEEALDELAASIKADGLLQNLVVRPAAPMDGYGQPMHRLVAGERRWRAIARLIKAGDWPADRGVPCQIRDLDDNAHAVAALLENLQRQDLKPLEEARAFHRLVRDHGFKTADIAGRINASQRMVQQRLQLLELPEMQQSMVDEGLMTVEGARKWLAERPKPVELEPAQLFMLVEMARRIAAKVPIRPWVRANADFSALHDGTAGELASLGCVGVLRSWNGECEIQLTGIGVETVLKAVPTLYTDAGAFAAFRATHVDADTLAKAGDRFVTPWLNGPFTRDPVRVKQEQDQERANKAREAARDAEERNRAALQADQQARGAEAIADIRALERDANELSIGAFQDRFGELLARYDAHAPWVIVNDGTPPSPEIKDAKGRANVGWGPMLEARRRLIVLAINFASGHRAFTGEPLAGGDPEVDQDDDETVDPDTDDGADGDTEDGREPPEYLKRLVGAGR